MRAVRIAVLVWLLALSLSGSGGTGTDFIISLRDPNAAARIHQQHGTRPIRQVPGQPVWLVHSDATDVQRVLQNLQNDPAITAAEINRAIALNSPPANSINPALAQDMVSLLDGQTRTVFFGSNVLGVYVNQPALTAIRLGPTRSSTGAATRVGYIDTGVDPTHPALAPWLEPGIDLIGNGSVSEFDGLSQDMVSLLDQDMVSLLDQRLTFLLNQSMVSLLDQRAAPLPGAFGHGTLVAGAIHVVAPESRIVPIKAFDAHGGTTMFAIVDAVYRATRLNLDVLNMSFSTHAQSDALRAAVLAAQASGIALVASAGNNSQDTLGLVPAGYPNVYAVAATDFSDRLASFSNYGQSVAISAPGAFVVSTAPGGRYAAAWGTSFSAPLVSGAIALVAQTRGRGQAASAVVVNSADPIDQLNPGLEKRLGKGRLNVERAVNVAR